jgi:hypothetical protein
MLPTLRWQRMKAHTSTPALQPRVSRKAQMQTHMRTTPPTDGNATSHMHPPTVLEQSRAAKYREQQCNHTHWHACSATLLPVTESCKASSLWHACSATLENMLPVRSKQMHTRTCTHNQHQWMTLAATQTQQHRPANARPLNNKE